MEINVLLVQVEDYGIQLIEIVYVKIQTGMAMLVLDAHQDKLGIKQVYHVHVQSVYSGMVFNVEAVQDKEHGISN